MSKETQDGNDKNTFLCKRNFIRKYVKSTTISHLKDVIDKNLLFSVYYSLFTYYKFGKNNMKLKISPDRFFTIISSMLYEVNETTLNKQLLIIIWSLVYIFAYTIAVNRNYESLENKLTGDNIHNNVSEHVIFECASNFVEVDGDHYSNSENEFVSGNNTSTTNNTSNRQKRKKKKDCVRNNNVEPVDVKCKEMKINNKSTNIIRNKTCNNTSNDIIKEIKMDKDFIIDKYIKDIHSMNQCVPINNIITTYPVVELTPCVIKDTTSTDTVLISSAAAAAATASASFSSFTTTNVNNATTSTSNNNFTNDEKVCF